MSDTRGVSIPTQQHGDCRRGVQNDQEPSAEIARIISVPQATDRYFRWFIQLDWFVLRQTFHELLEGRLLSHLLDLREQVIGERHPCLSRPDFQFAMQIIRYVAYLDHLRHVKKSITCVEHAGREMALG